MAIIVLLLMMIMMMMRMLDNHYYHVEGISASDLLSFVMILMLFMIRW